MPHAVWGNFTAIIAGGVLILGVYWLVGRLLKVSELSNLASLVAGRLGRRRSATPSESSSEEISEITATQDALRSGETGSTVLGEDLMPTAIAPALTDEELRRRDSERDPEDDAPATKQWDFLIDDDTETHTAIDDAEDTDGGENSAPPRDADDTGSLTADGSGGPSAPLIPPPAPAPQEGISEVLDELFRPSSDARIAEDGAVVHARYQLTELLTERGGSETWRAHDQVLSRDVVVHLLRKEDPRAEELLTAARRGAIATESRFLRILDAGKLADPELEIGAYVVCEYAPGKSLTKMLKSGPLSSMEAGWIVRELADALAGVHAQGQFHERITPDTVVITTSGTVRIVGFGIESALASPLGDERPWSERERGDIEALGALLYAMLVHRWPGRSLFGLKAAPTVQGRLALPSELRSGVSPALERVCLSAMNSQGVRTARELANALTDLLGTADASSDLEERVRRPPKPALSLAEPSVELERVAAAPTATRSASSGTPPCRRRRRNRRRRRKSTGTIPNCTLRRDPPSRGSARW